MRGSPSAVQKWLNRISDQSWKTVISKAYQFANRELANQVCHYFDNELAGKFPLSRGASDASTTGFNEYFSPAGIEAAFANEFIAPFVNVSNGQYRRVNGRSFPIRAETLTLVRRADAIRTALYSQNPELASLQLNMLPLKLDGSVRSFSLQSSYDQAPISYKHGPKLPSTIDWNSSASGYAQLSFTDISGSSRSQEYISDWSMLRIFNDSIIEGTRRDNVLNVTFHKDDLHAKYQVKSNSSLEAIQYGSLLKYQCPSSL
jgi:type VI secretion system protein ImpL